MVSNHTDKLYLSPRTSFADATQDQHNRLIADVLTRFRNLCHFATAQADTEGKDPDPAAMGVSRLSMQLEFEGLVSSTPSRPHRSPPTLSHHGPLPGKRETPSRLG